MNVFDMSVGTLCLGLLGWLCIFLAIILPLVLLISFVLTAGKWKKNFFEYKAVEDFRKACINKKAAKEVYRIVAYKTKNHDTAMDIITSVANAVPQQAPEPAEEYRVRCVKAINYIWQMSFKPNIKEVMRILQGSRTEWFGDIEEPKEVKKDLGSVEESH